MANARQLDPREGQLFHSGELNRDIQMGRRYWNEVFEPYAGPADDLGDWMWESYFDK
jgi:hypothetical protein